MDNKDYKNLDVCIKKCKYDYFDLCSSCYRTKTEMLEWNKYTEDQKLNILEKIKIRKLPGQKYTI